MSTEMPTVYEHPLSPYAQKIKVALREKAVDFELRRAPSGAGSEERLAYESVNPRSEVPLFLINGRAVFDSSIILEYIENKWPEPNLLPSGPELCAELKMIEEMMDTHFEANTWGMSEIVHFGRASGKLAEQMLDYGRAQVQRWFAWLETRLGNKSWFTGEQFGWGDICVVPFVNGAARFDIHPACGSRLESWLANANERPSVALTWREAQAAELDPERMQVLLKCGFKRQYRDYRLEWMLKAGGLSVVEKAMADNNIRFSDPFKPE